jgi:hypothetical protein
MVKHLHAVIIFAIQVYRYTASCCIVHFKCLVCLVWFPLFDEDCVKSEMVL